MQNEILVGRFNQGLTRKFNITGGAPSPQLCPEIVPVMQVGHEPEDLLPQLERLCAGFCPIGQVALKTNTARILNPAGSGMIAVVERLLIISSGAGAFVTINLNLNIGQLSLAQRPPAPGPTFVDSRILTAASVPQPACVLSFDQGPPGILGPNVAQIVTGTLQAYTWDEPIVLGPGGSLDVSNAENNQNTTVNFYWRERPATLGELQYP